MSLDTTIVEVIRDALGPDVTIDSFDGTIMPYDAAYERRISQANTFDWWIKAHNWSEKGYKTGETLWHDRFRLYCHKCRKAGD